MKKVAAALAVAAIAGIALAFLFLPGLTSTTTVGGKIGVQFYNEDGTPIAPSWWERLFGGYAFMRDGTPIASNFDATVTITVAYTSGIDAAKGITVVTALIVTCRLQSPTGGVVNTDTSKSWATEHGGQEPLVQSVKGSYDLLTLTKALTNPNDLGWSIVFEATLTATGQNTEGQTITATGTATFTFTVKYTSGTITVSGAISA